MRDFWAFLVTLVALFFILNAILGGAGLLGVPGTILLAIIAISVSIPPPDPNRPRRPQPPYPPPPAGAKDEALQQTTKGP